MALNKITAKDFEEALDELTPYGEGSTCWIKELGKTENGTGLYLVIGWTRELGYTQDDIDANGFGGGDSGDCIAYKIGYFNYKPGMRYMLQDFDTFNMPYNLTDDKANGIYMGDVWETDGMLPNSPDSWSTIADDLNKDAQGIWDTWGENGELDQMAESKKSAAKKHTCSMQKKIESLKKKSAKKSESISASSIRVDPYDVAVKVQEVNEYPSTNGFTLTAEVPAVEAWFNDLSEFKDCVVGLAENCNGYPTISRDGSDILVQINAPIDDENGEFTGDYEVIVELRCSTEITHSSLEGVVDVLNGDA